MGLSEEDRILIKNLYFYKGYGAVRLINEFPAKGWKKSTLNDFIKKRVRDVDELKQRLVEVWSDFGQIIVDEAIDNWRKRLQACVRARGHQFEHLL